MKDRAVWDALMEREGRALGLSGCRPFLENKLVNDIFYEGTFKGAPCIVKCSSRAPESIANEYRMSRRLAAVDRGVCAEALAKWTSPDGGRAFVVTRRLAGPSLTEMIIGGVTEDEALDIVDDMLRIAKALVDAGIVWRDITTDNFLRDADGHIKLIDAQFAIDRNDFREDPYLLSHWNYRMLLFAHHPMLAGHGWDDVGMMLRYASYLPPTHLVKERLERLRALERESMFPVSRSRGDRLRMACCLLGMEVARCFSFSVRRRHVLRERIGRAKRFITGRPSW